MKPQIVMSIVLFFMIAFVGIVDGKGFKRSDAVHAAQSEIPVNRSNLLADSMELKHASEVKPETGIKFGMQTQSVAMESADNQRQISGENTKGVKPAISTVTAKDATKSNEDAMDYASAEIETREPFYELYQNSKLETVCFQGTIRATSTIPDPEKNDYDSCLYALFVEIDSLLSDVTKDTKVPCEIIITVPIMKNKTILQNNIFLLGDKVRCTCAEYGAMPQGIQEIQLSDDIQSFEHQQYYSIAICKISEFQEVGTENRNFAKRTISILPVQTFPKDDKAAELRKERIQNEIARVEEEIKKHGGSFTAWRKEYKPISEKYRSLCKEEWKGWIGDSYFATGGSGTGYRPKDFIESILPYKQYLEKNNIDLIIVRIPSRDDFASCVLASDSFQENPAWMEHYYECLKNDIEIVDPMPEMWNHRFDYPLFYYYYPKEHHPAEGTSMIAAKVVSSVLERYNFSKSDSPILLQKTCYETKNPIYYWPKGNDHFDPESNITFMQSVQNGKSIGELKPNTGHPLLFLSNSFFWHPQRSLGASVPAYAAYYLQTIPDWFYRNEAGNGLFRTLILNSDLLRFRKVVVMVGHPTLWSQKQPNLPPYLMTDNTPILSLENTIDDFDKEIVITPSDFYTFSVNNDKELEIKPVSKEASNTPKSFSFELTVPPIPAKKECMVKFNFVKTNHITLSCADKNTNEIIEPGYTLSSETMQGAFFVSIGSTPKTLVITMTPHYSSANFILKNFELWYY